MPNFNSITLCGHLTRDPQTKFLPNQTQIAEFGIAVSEKFKDKERVCFIDCTAFGKLAEIVGKYCQKGKPVLLQGKLRQDIWDDKNGGGKRSKHTIVVDTLQLLGGKSDAAQGQAGPSNPISETQEIDPDLIPF